MRITEQREKRRGSMDQRRPTLYSSSDPELGNIEEQEEPEVVFEPAGTTGTTARHVGKTDTKIPVKTKAGRPFC